MMNTIILIIPK